MSSVRKAYQQFLNTPHGVDAYEKFKRILYSDDDSLVRMLETQVLQRLPAVGRSVVHVCDIGGGSGERVSHILAYLQGKFHNEYELDFIEQSLFYVRQFGSRALPQFCRTRVLPGLFEEIRLPQHQYDLVLLIHSIFAFANGASVDGVLSLPRSDGTVVVVSNMADSFLAGLKRLVDVGFDDNRYEIDDLRRSLGERKVPFSTHLFETIWEIDARAWADDMAVILDWISLGRFNSFGAERKRCILDYICDSAEKTNAGMRFREKEIVLIVAEAESV